MKLNSFSAAIITDVTMLPHASEVQKPGTHILVHSTPTTHHTLAMKVENLGFEIRDVIVHLYDANVEHWILCRTPIVGSVAENVLKWGVGGLNIGATRIGTDIRQNSQKDTSSWHGNNWSGSPQKSSGVYKEVVGRFPANLILSHSDGCAEICQSGCAVQSLNEQSGIGASKFFYVAKDRKDIIAYLTKLILPEGCSLFCGKV